MSEATATAEAPTETSTAPVDTAPQSNDQAEYQAFKAGKPSAEETTAPKPETPAGEPAEGDEQKQEPQKPWKANAPPPERLSRMVAARDARIQELEAKLSTFEKPAPSSTPAAPEESSAEPDPYDAKYYKPDGTFDSVKYLKDNNAWVAENAVKTFEKRQADARAAEEKAQTERAEMEALTTAQASFSEKLEQQKAADPELGEKVAWFAENFAQKIPDRVARELLHSDPRVIGVLAENKAIRDGVIGGDIYDAIKIIGIIEDRLSASAPSAPAQNAPEKPRAPNGQFVPKAAPPVPMELPTRGGSSSSGLFSDDYQTFKKARKALNS